MLCGGRLRRPHTASLAGFDRISYQTEWLKIILYIMEIWMIYILLPAYNESNCIEELVRRIDKSLKRKELKFQIIVYNDGSTDTTLDILKKLSKTFKLTIIDGVVNKGLGHGVKTLLEYFAKISKDEDCGIIMDADNTHNPEQIHTMVDLLYDGFDLVVASRYKENSRTIGVSFFRRQLSNGMALMMRILFYIHGMKDYSCGFRAYKSSMIKRAFAVYKDSFVTETSFACMFEILLKLAKLKFLMVEIPMVLRYDMKGGASKMNVAKTIIRTLRVLFTIRFMRVKSS
jgi:dolichol-phosphate mannosyltransferase